MDSDGKDKASTSESRRQKLFVGGLSRDTSDDSLKQYFLNYGDLSDCVVIRDSATKESRGFGYVTFNDYRITKTVLQDKRDKGDHKIDNKAVEVKRAIPRDDDSNSSKIKTTKVFIGGIPDVANEEDITKAVCDALEGEIVKVDLIKKKEDGEVVGHRGFCFVQLENEDDADELCCIKRVEVKGKWVEMKKAEPKGSDGGGGRGRGGRGGGYAGRGRGGGGGTYGSSGGFGGGSQFGGGGYGGGGGGGSGYDQYSGYGGYGGGGYSSYGGGGGGNNYYENYGGDMSSMYGQSAYYPPSGGGGSSARGGARGGSRYRPY